MSAKKNLCRTCLNYKNIPCGCSNGRIMCGKCRGSGSTIRSVSEKDNGRYVHKTIQVRCCSGYSTCFKCHGKGKLPCRSC